MNPRFLSILLLLLVSGAAGFCATVEGLPEPAAPHEPQIVLPQEKTLPNGLRVVVVARPGLPLVSAKLLLRDGSEADPPAAAGLASFTAGLLTQGTETRSATQIAREIEALGATLKAEADWDATSVDLSTLSSNLAPALGLLADVVRHPKFAAEEVERLRRQSLDELRVSLEEPRTIARAAAHRVLLGGGLYAHPRDGTLASLARIRRDDIAKFHREHFVPAKAHLLIAGNVTAEAAFTLAEKIFGPWESHPEEGPPAAARPFAITSTGRVVLIDLPNAGQAAVYLATAAIPRRADDYFAGLVANTVLGGGYTSWLNQEIRVKRGLSYGARSMLDARRAGGLCLAGCQTKNTSAAEVATLLRDQLTRLGSEPADADFFSARQAVLIGDFSRHLETNADYVEELARLATHDQSFKELTSYPDHIRAVTPAAARDFAARHYTPSQFNLVIAGRAADIAKPLKAIFPQTEIIESSALDLDSPTLTHESRP